MKNDLFLTGYTEEYLQKREPQVIKLIKNGLKIGSLKSELFCHPIFSLIPYEDASRQIRVGLD